MLPEINRLGIDLRYGSHQRFAVGCCRVVALVVAVVLPDVPERFASLRGVHPNRNDRRPGAYPACKKHNNQQREQVTYTFDIESIIHICPFQPINLLKMRLKFIFAGADFEDSTFASRFHS